MINSIQYQQDMLISEFQLFDNWMEKYEYLIDLGKELSPLEESLKKPENLIKGCQSQVWLHSELKNGKVILQADSDAIITKGLIALIIRVLNNQAPEDIYNSNLYLTDQIGLNDHLSPSRSNGLNSMIKQIKMDSLALQMKKIPIAGI
jgi:cysteine desulfuration protein SufE